MRRRSPDDVYYYIDPPSPRACYVSVENRKHGLLRNRQTPCAVVVGPRAQTIFHARFSGGSKEKHGPTINGRRQQQPSDGQRVSYAAVITLTTSSANSRSSSHFSGMGNVGVTVCSVSVPELSTTQYVISGGSSSWKIENC